MTDSLWTLRPAHPDDIAFIYSTWLHSYRYDSAIGRQCTNSVYYPEYTKVIDKILSSPDTKITVACMPTDEYVIFGYCVRETNTEHFVDAVHYVFVKEAFWRKGIAKDLVGGVAPHCITHRTEALKPILVKYPWIQYNPFKLYDNKGDKYAPYKTSSVSQSAS